MLLNQSLLSHIGITLAETLLSFLLVTGISAAAAVLLWLFPRFAEVSEPYMVILNSLPKSALAPLLIVWLGANMRTIIVAGMSVALFGSIMSLYAGFRETDPDMVKLVQTLGGGKSACLLKVVLPSSVPYLLSTFKVNIGLCLVGVVIGEFIGARKGLGYLIIYGSQVFKLKHGNPLHRNSLRHSRGSLRPAWPAGETVSQGIGGVIFRSMLPEQNPSRSRVI